MPSNLTAQTKPDIEKLDDAVVLVMIYDYKGNFVGHGSGFIIDNKGTVVTNYHVVKGAFSLKVRVDNNGVKTDYDVENILSGDQSKDLAKISLKNPYATVFPFLPLAKTYPSKGDDCWAIGTPADPKYMNTVSKGLISNIDLNSDPKVLQTNAEITHGSSGGALINSKGEVIGITSAGDVSDDGARASINFAIWIGELNNLPIINKKSIVDPTSIPCQLGFYTNSPYTGNVYLYIDGIYVGSFSKYFQNNYTPTCGEDGTITRNLYSGTHFYQVYFANTGQWYYGTVTLNPGQCQIYRVGGVTPTYTQTPFYYTKDYRGIKDYKFLLGTNVFRSINFLYYFNDGKYGVQAFWYRNKDILDNNNSYVKTTVTQNYGVDLRRVFRPEKRWSHLYIGPSVRLLNTKTNTDSTVYVGFPLNYVSGNKKTNQSQLFLNARVGVEFVIFNRLAINFDIGAGYLTGKKRLNMDADLVLGYRFGRKKQ
jgi:hypothetical protein